MSGVEVLLLLVMVLGLLGAVLPVLPGAALVLGSVVVWGFVEQRTGAWIVVAACAVVLVAGAVLTYLVPGRRLAGAGVPRSSLLTAAGAGIVGFFVVPVVGLPVGFVLGLWAAERARLGPEESRRSTSLALRAVGLSILVEFTTSLLAVLIWVTAVVLR